MKQHARTSLAPGGSCVECGYATASASVAACPQCGWCPQVDGAPRSDGAPRRGGTVGSQSPTIEFDSTSAIPMRYPNPYVWFILASALDIMLTWCVLNVGGSEVNPVAESVIDRFGLPGMVAFKFALVIFVIIMCEWVGRRSDRIGRKIAQWAVAMTSIPIVLSFVILLGTAWRS